MVGGVSVRRCVVVALVVVGAVVGVVGSPRPAGANVTGISVSVSSGGSCSDASTPSGFDDAFDCDMDEGTSLVVVGSAYSNRSSLSWSSTGGVSDSESQGTLMVEVLPDFSTRYYRDNTATLSCTSDGTATLTARDGSDTDRIRLTVDCDPLPSVEISGWDGDSRDAPGDMSDDFTVSPSSSSCTASRSSGSISAGEVDIDISGAGTSTRTVDVTTTATGSVVVEVECSRSGHNDASDTATFTARRVAVSISGWDGASGTVGDVLTDAFRVDPTTASCTARRRSGISSSDLDIAISGTGLVRTVTVESDVAGTASVEVRCTNSEYSTGTARASFVFAALPDVSISGWNGDSRDAPGAMSDDFTVSPSSSSCTASRSSGSITASEASIVISGAGSSTRTVDVTTTATGSLVVEVECSRSGHNDASDTATFTARRIAVSISGWDGASGSVGDVLTDAFRAGPTTASCTAARSSGIAASALDIEISGTGLVRTVTVESDVAGTASVQVRCTNSEYNAGTARASFVFAALPDVEIDGLDDVSGVVGTLAGDFTVSPSSAACEPERVSGIAATLSISGAGTADRTLSVAATGPGEVTVEVTCSRSGHNAATDTAIFTFEAVPVDSVGVSASEGGECSADATPPSGVDGAWDCWMGIGRQLTIEATATSSDADLGVGWPTVTGGVTVADDDEGDVQTSVVGSHTVYSLTSTATIECTSDGSATVESSVDGVVGHTGRVGIDCRPLVEIDDLDDASGTRPRGESEPVTVSEEFTVSPARAECSVATDSDVDAVLSFPVDSGSTRTVAARISDDSGTVTVEVTCPVDGEYAPTTEEADLTPNALASVEDVSADATSGGGCDAADASTTLPAGVDEQWDCWMGEGRELTVVVTATNPAGGLSLSWPADGRSGGVTLSEIEEGKESYGELTLKHQRSTTAKFGCTADGTARVVTTLDGAEAHVGRVSVDCRPVVEITGLDGDADSSGTMTDDFEVTPASATCTSAASGFAAVASVTSLPGQPSKRRLTVGVTGTATGTVTVEVTCEAQVGDQKYAPTTVTAEFVRFGDCTEDLGVLRHGSVTRSGTISVDPDCVSWKRGSASSPNYARRYTFRVPAASRVSVDATSGLVDTYLYVLHGNGAAAQVLGSDDDGHTAGRTDSRVSDVRVLPGLTYVVEITSKTAREHGPYALAVTTAPDLPAVKITGLVPMCLIRNGTHTLSSGFTVEPATAQCAPGPGLDQPADGRRPYGVAPDVRVCAGDSRGDLLQRRQQRRHREDAVLIGARDRQRHRQGAQRRDLHRVGRLAAGRGRRPLRLRGGRDGHPESVGRVPRRAHDAGDRLVSRPRCRRDRRRVSSRHAHRDTPERPRQQRRRSGIHPHLHCHLDLHRRWHRHAHRHRRRDREDRDHQRDVRPPCRSALCRGHRGARRRRHHPLGHHRSGSGVHLGVAPPGPLPVLRPASHVHARARGDGVIRARGSAGGQSLAGRVPAAARRRQARRVRRGAGQK